MPPFPSIARRLPDGNNVYVVFDDFGELFGRAGRETDEKRTNREILIVDLLKGQYSNPVRVVAFNTAVGWSLDVSREIAGELVLRIALDNRETPAGLEGFFARNIERRPVRLQLPLRSAG
jgi:hypothetical protein